MDVQIFKENGWEIRTIIKDGEPWFVAKDIALALGYSDTTQAVRSHCKKANDFKGRIGNAPAWNPTPIKIIPESDVYRLIMRSNLPKAEEFQDWVVEVVLPEIRKTGGYLHTMPEDTPELIMAKAIKFAEAKIKMLEHVITKTAPAVDFRNYATKKGTQWTITDAKNQLEISLARLQEHLVMVNFFMVKKMARNNRLWPKDKYIDCGYCVDVQDGPNYAFTCKGMEFLKTLVYEGAVKAENLFEIDRQPDLFEE